MPTYRKHTSSERQENIRKAIEEYKKNEENGGELTQKDCCKIHNVKYSAYIYYKERLGVRSTVSESSPSSIRVRPKTRLDPPRIPSKEIEPQQEPSRYVLEPPRSTSRRGSKDSLRAKSREPERVPCKKVRLENLDSYRIQVRKKDRV